MIGGFYGLTGVNLILSPIAFVTFRELIRGIDTQANRYQLAVLKAELNDILKFLDEFPIIYSDPKLNKISSLLRREKKSTNPDYDKVMEWTKLLESNSDKVEIASSAVIASGNITISPQAKVFIEFLLNKRDLIKKYESLIPNTEKESSGLAVFGQPIYLLRNRRRVSLDYCFNGVHGEVTNNLESLKRDVDLLSSLLVEDNNFSLEPKKTKISKMYDEVERVVLSMNLEYFDRLFGFSDTSLEFYYNLSNELMDLGLYLFNIFPEDLFNEFSTTVSLNTDTDLYISNNTYPEMYRFITDVKEAYDSLVAVNGGEKIE